MPDVQTFPGTSAGECRLSGFVGEAYFVRTILLGKRAGNMLLDLGVKRAAILAGPLSDEDFGIGATLVVEAGVVYRDTLASPHTPSAFLAVAITTN